MADPNPTAGEPLKAKAVTDDEVNAAVDAYRADPGATARPIAYDHSLNCCASQILDNTEARPPVKRAAILLARV